MIMKAPKLLSVGVIVLVSFALSRVHAQTARPKAADKPVSFTFDAYIEQSHGEIYRDDFLVSVTIDAAGIRYQAKGAAKPYVMP